MHDDKIRCFLDKLGTGWVTFSKKPSAASQTGVVVWERQIRLCRSILNSILKNYGTSLAPAFDYPVFILVHITSRMIQ